MYKKSVLGLGLFFIFLGGFIAAEIVCYHIPPVRMEVPLFIFAAIACLIIGVILMVYLEKIGGSNGQNDR